MAGHQSFQQLLVFLIFNHSVVTAANSEESLFQNFVIDLQKMRDEHRVEVDEMQRVIEEQNKIIQNLTEIVGDTSPNYFGNSVQNAIENFNATINSKIDVFKATLKEINATNTDQNQAVVEVITTMNERLGAVEEDVISLETGEHSFIVHSDRLVSSKCLLKYNKIEILKKKASVCFSTQLTV